MFLLGRERPESEAHLQAGGALKSQTVWEWGTAAGGVRERLESGARRQAEGTNAGVANSSRVKHVGRPWGANGPRVGHVERQGGGQTLRALRHVARAVQIIVGTSS